jgi:hypothetical protein
LFARPVKKEEQDNWESYKSYEIEESDAWYVWLAIGSADTLTKMFDIFIPKLKYIIRKKDDKFRIVETDRLIKKIEYGKRS